MNQQLSELNQRLNLLEKNEVELEDELNNVRREIARIESMICKIMAEEEANVQLKDAVIVWLKINGTQYRVSQPATVLGKLAIISRFGWQVCSVYQGRRIKSCDSYKEAFDLLNALQVFDWEWVERGLPPSLELVKYLRELTELDSAKFYVYLRVKPLCLTQEKEHPFPKWMECSKLTESSKLSQYDYDSLSSS